VDDQPPECFINVDHLGMTERRPPRRGFDVTHLRGEDHVVPDLVSRPRGVVKRLNVNTCDKKKNAEFDEKNHGGGVSKDTEVNENENENKNAETENEKSENAKTGPCFGNLDLWYKSAYELDNLDKSAYELAKFRPTKSESDTNTVTLESYSTKNKQGAVEDVNLEVPGFVANEFKEVGKDFKDELKMKIMTKMDKTFADLGDQVPHWPPLFEGECEEVREAQFQSYGQSTGRAVAGRVLSPVESLPPPAVTEANSLHWSFS
jgi:hypothetical protein